MKQKTLAMAADQGAGFERYRKPTRRDEFLQTMEAIVPWAALCAVIEPYYPKGVGGRPPIGLQRMLRIHFLQHWFNLADVACEEALYDSANHRGEVDEAMRAKNRSKSRIRARVEHVFGVVKRLWGFSKVRYRGLAKNATRAFTTLALANIYLGRRQLMAQVRP